jgi:hypothetical protein
VSCAFFDASRLHQVEFLRECWPLYAFISVFAVIYIGKGGHLSYKTPAALIALRGTRRVLFSLSYDVQRHEANYDYHADYDAGYLRFGRVEKQLD